MNDNDEKGAREGKGKGKEDEDDVDVEDNCSTQFESESEKRERKKERRFFPLSTLNHFNDRQFLHSTYVQYIEDG